MGRNIRVVGNDRAMAYVVAGPYYDIVAYSHSWLNGLIFQDKAVISDIKIWPSN